MSADLFRRNRKSFLSLVLFVLSKPVFLRNPLLSGSVCESFWFLDVMVLLKKGSVVKGVKCDFFSLGFISIVYFDK